MRLSKSFRAQPWVVDDENAGCYVFSSQQQSIPSEVKCKVFALICARDIVLRSTANDEWCFFFVFSQHMAQLLFVLYSLFTWHGVYLCEVAFLAADLIRNDRKVVRDICKWFS